MLTQVKTFTLLFFLYAGLAFSQEYRVPALQGKLSWMDGVWQINAFTFEEWAYSDSGMKAISYELQGRDTIINQKMQIRYIGNDIYFISTTINLNKEEKVNYKLVSDDFYLLVFENKETDYPQRIGYEKEKKAIKVWTEGEEKGKPRRAEFKMKAAKL